MADFFSPLPEYVRINGAEYKINTDFRIWLHIERELCGVKSGGALAKCLAAAYPTLPPKPYGAVEGVLWFCSEGKYGGKACGGAEKADAEEKDVTYTAALYDCECDSEYIWSAFFGQYGIDLTTEHMHWWKFRALLSGLDKDCRFSQILAYRSISLSEIRDREQRRFYEKMKKLYRLPDRRTDDEKERELTESLESLF